MRVLAIILGTVALSYLAGMFTGNRLAKYEVHEEVKVMKEYYNTTEELLDSLENEYCISDTYDAFIVGSQINARKNVEYVFSK